jgi:hypothetical protein
MRCRLYDKGKKGQNNLVGLGGKKANKQILVAVCVDFPAYLLLKQSFPDFEGRRM